MSQNLLQSAIFWVFALLGVGSALAAVRQKSLIYTALYMLLVFLSLTGFFLLNNADFLAIAQLILYAVGITIIMLFAIMFTGDRPFNDERVSKSTLVAYGLVTVFTFALLLKSIGFPFRSASAPGASGLQYLNGTVPQSGSTAMLGETLFRTYGLPFELASVLLLVAMIGAIVLAKKRFEPSHTDSLKYELDPNSHPTKAAQKALDERETMISGGAK